MTKYKVVNAHQSQVTQDGKLIKDNGVPVDIEIDIATPEKAGTVKPAVRGSEGLPVAVDAQGRLYYKDTVYKLPQAGTELGGVKAKEKDMTYTREVKIDSDGYLWVQAPEENTSNLPLIKLDKRLLLAGTIARLLHAGAYDKLTTIELTLNYENNNMYPTGDIGYYVYYHIKFKASEALETLPPIVVSERTDWGLTSTDLDGETYTKDGLTYTFTERPICNFTWHPAGEDNWAEYAGILLKYQDEIQNGFMYNEYRDIDKNTSYYPKLVEAIYDYTPDFSNDVYAIRRTITISDIKEDPDTYNIVFKLHVDEFKES